jgi:hypothetical protein
MYSDGLSEIPTISVCVRLCRQTKREVAAYTYRGKEYCRNATVRNPGTARAKKRPFSEAAQVKD